MLVFQYFPELVSKSPKMDQNDWRIFKIFWNFLIRSVDWRWKTTMSDFFCRKQTLSRIFPLKWRDYLYWPRYSFHAWKTGKKRLKMLISGIFSVLFAFLIPKKEIMLPLLSFCWKLTQSLKTEVTRKQITPIFFQKRKFLTPWYAHVPT